MPKFEVNLIKQLNFTVKIDAVTEEEALEQAYAIAPEICAHCTGWRKEWSIDEDEWQQTEEFYHNNFNDNIHNPTVKLVAGAKLEAE